MIGNRPVSGKADEEWPMRRPVRTQVIPPPDSGVESEMLVAP
jgi:hypothetical protein